MPIFVTMIIERCEDAICKADVSVMFMRSKRFL